MAETKKKTAAKTPKVQDSAGGGSKAFTDLRAKTDDQLLDQLTDLKREQFNLRFQAATNQLERPARIREVRRSIAQIKTLQTERQSQSARPAAKA